MRKTVSSALALVIAAGAMTGVAAASERPSHDRTALLATRRSAAAIESADFSEAVERTVAGPQRRSRILSPADKRRVAVHEAGHAVVAASQPGTGQVAKVSLVARGHAQGSTMSMPEGDRILATRSELSDRIAVLLGGRAAEELVLGQPSTGSNDDLARATSLARRMVTECGMSDRLGPLAFGSIGEEPSLGWSEATVAEIDAETRRIVDSGWSTATEALVANRRALHALAEELITTETLEGVALAALLGAVLPPADTALWGELASSMPAPSAIARTELATLAS